MSRGGNSPLAVKIALWGGREIVGLLIVSLLAGTATIPYIAYHFHRISPYGVVANLVAMPVVSAWIMPAGILGLARRVPAPQAAFANAALIHILDFDDIHDEARLHPTPVALSAALAAASLCDAGGKRVLEATVLGDELICRLGAMIGPSLGPTLFR